MTVYDNNAADARIASVEFRSEEGQTLAFFRLADATKMDAVRALLTHGPLRQQVMATTVADGESMIVTRGMASPETVLAALAAEGETLLPRAAEKKPFNPWAWRGYTSLLGQGLQIVSSKKTIGSASDNGAIFGFAALNLVANAINIIFGGQEKQDPHHLRALKQECNAQLAPYVAAGALPDPDDDRLSQRPSPPTAAGERFSQLLSKYSVSFGEIFLRTIGSASLAFPFAQWKDVGKTWRETKSFGKAFEASKNHNPATFAVGLMMLTGKGVSFLSREPDPYNPEPPGLVRQFREKVTFRLSSVIEAFAASYMGYDRWRNKRILIGGVEHPDYYGMAGNAVFVGGYGMRLMAPYGSRVVNMPELYAHMADGLAQLPRAELAPRVLALAVHLDQHFRHAPPDKKHPVDVASIYQHLVAELATHHQITLAPLPEVPPRPEAVLPLSQTGSPATQVVGAATHQRLAPVPACMNAQLA